MTYWKLFLSEKYKSVTAVMTTTEKKYDNKHDSSEGVITVYLQRKGGIPKGV